MVHSEGSRQCHATSGAKIAGWAVGLCATPSRQEAVVRTQVNELQRSVECRGLFDTRCVEHESTAMPPPPEMTDVLAAGLDAAAA